MALRKQQLSYLLIPLTLMSSIAWGERYSVQEDSFGNLTAKHVEAESTNESSNNSSEIDLSTSSETQGNGASSEEVVPVSTVQKSQIPESSAVEREAAVESTTNEVEELSPFEKAYLEAEKREKQRILDGLKNAPILDSYDATKVEPVNFVDGDELLKGKVKNVSPYYTVIDADGTPRNIYYDPDELEEVLNKKNQSKIQLTQATIFKAQNEMASVPVEAETKALSILFGENKTLGFFQRFSNSCCERLPNIETPTIEFSQSRYIEIEKELLPVRLEEGDTRFVLLGLPDDEKLSEYPIAIRSFIREQKREGVEHGVFFPQIATLDINRKPIRIFTDPLYKYHEETWTTHGYLEGFFMINDTLESDEKFLLLYTTSDALKQSSTIEGEDKTITVEHMNIGAIEVEVMAEREDNRFVD